MKIVFTAAVMDLLHEGHLNLLGQMRKSGDLTLVILHDGFTTFENKRKLPIENLEKRTRNLIDTGLVDIIWHTYEKSPKKEFMRVIDRFRDHELLFMRGDDWAGFPGKWLLDAHNVEQRLIPYTKGVSSTFLRDKL